MTCHRAATEGLAQLLQTARVWRGLDLAPFPALSTGFTLLDEQLPGGGWPAGALTEIFTPCAGVGELGLLVPALQALSLQRRHTVFIAPPFIPYAPGLAAAGIALPTVYWILPRKDEDARWSAEQILRDGSAGAVLLWTDAREDRALRRLQLAAETGRNHAFVYRPLRYLSQSSPAALRIALEPRGDQVAIHVVKVRGGRPAHVQMAVGYQSL